MSGVMEEEYNFTTSVIVGESEHPELLPGSLVTCSMDDITESAAVILRQMNRTTMAVNEEYNSEPI